jgi:hypothetical protein
LGYFDEAVEDEDEFLGIGAKSLAKDIFLTFATNFWTEAPAFEHHFRKCSRQN